MDYFRNLLVTDQTYHIFNKSIIGGDVFKNKYCLSRFLECIQYYQIKEPPIKLSDYISSGRKADIKSNEKLVSLICYCLMPNHFHLVLKQLLVNGISTYMNKLLNSYSRYYNTKFDRKGPIWEGRFKRVRVASDDQLLHLTRYIHLNPVTSYIVKKPEDYRQSSYREYIGLSETSICQKELIINKTLDKVEYQKFVYSRINYQQELQRMKDLLVD